MLKYHRQHRPRILHVHALWSLERKTPEAHSIQDQIRMQPLVTIHRYILSNQTES